MAREPLDAEGYPTDPTTRSQEQQVERLLDELPRTTAPRTLRAEVMAELRATPPSLMTRLRHRWSQLGGWRVPLQLAPVAALVAIAIVGHQFLELQPETAPGALDGEQLAMVIDDSRGEAVESFVPAARMQRLNAVKTPQVPPAEEPTEVAVLRGSDPEPEEVEAQIEEPSEVAVQEATPDEAAPDETAVVGAQHAAPVEPEEHETTTIEPAPVVVATPVGAGTPTEIEDRHAALPDLDISRMAQERDRLREELEHNVELAALPEPIEVTPPPPEPSPSPRMTITAERIDSVTATPLGTPPPRRDDLQTPHSGVTPIPGALAFNGSTALPLAPETQASETTRLSVETDDPETLIASIEALVENLSGHVSATRAVTSDGNVRQVSGELPRWRIETLRRGLVLLTTSQSPEALSVLLARDAERRPSVAERRPAPVEILVYHRPIQ